MDVTGGLMVGALQGPVEGGGPAFAMSGGGWKRGFGSGFGAVGIDPLFGFEDEAFGFVEIDPVGGGGAVGMFTGDEPFEDVEIFGVVFDRRIGGGKLEELAEFEEKLVACPAFVPAGRSPFFDEPINGGRVGGRHGGANGSSSGRVGKGGSAVAPRSDASARHWDDAFSSSKARINQKPNFLSRWLSGVSRMKSRRDVQDGSKGDPSCSLHSCRKAEGTSACIMDFMSRFDQKLAVLVVN